MVELSSLPAPYSGSMIYFEHSIKEPDREAAVALKNNNEFATNTAPAVFANNSISNTN